MRSYPFKLVDVFTDKPLEGNLLPVVFEADSLSDDEMQAVAREFNASETTFVLRPKNEKAPWRLRSFTPKAEVYGAGHNALGACWALAENDPGAFSEGRNVVYQEIGSVLPLEIYIAGGRIEKILMTQDAPVFGETFSDFKALAGALNLDEADFDPEGPPPQAVSTGAFHFLVPVKNLGVLKKVQADPVRLAALAKPLGCEGCYLYSLETVEEASAAHTRAFFPGIGISEDPATGTAAGPLAVLLVSKGILPEGEALIIEQGFEINRPSRIEVSVAGETVRVGGRCVTVGEGNLNL